jgi:hypothetical protein
VEKCLIGLLLLYTSQNLLGMIFRVTFTVSYRRIWDIVGKYSILCCDSNGHDSTISGVVDVASHGGPILDTLDMIEHDPCLFQISSGLHSIDQVHPGSRPYLGHLENKHLV